MNGCWAEGGIGEEFAVGVRLELRWGSDVG